MGVFDAALSWLGRVLRAEGIVEIKVRRVQDGIVLIAKVEDESKLGEIERKLVEIISSLGLSEVKPVEVKKE